MIGTTMTTTPGRAGQPLRRLRLPGSLGLLAALIHALLLTCWRRSVSRLRSDSGMSTAEYAIGTIAAAAFAAILYTVVTGDSVVSGLSKLVQRALSADL